MAFLVRFVQHYRPVDHVAFLQLEAAFAAMEQARDDYPKGRRFQPFTGREPSSTLIWEAEFPTLELAEQAIGRIARDPEHADLFSKQALFILDTFTEIYEVLKF